MIDWNKTEIETGKSKEYFDKFPKSAKKVYRICDKCKQGKWIIKNSYSDLCNSCSKKGIITGKNHPWYGRKHSKETKNKIKQKAIKQWEDINKREDMIKKINKRWDNPKQHEKMCIAQQKRWNNFESHKQASASQQGINIEDWDGFVKDQKYCYKFNNQLKQLVRDRYNNCDYISGIHKDICNNGINLSVHHVDYNKQQGCDGNKWDLIPLSQKNHAKTNFNRSFWNRLFKYSLEIDKWYYGDDH